MCVCRARREDLKTCYNGLRQVIPSLADKANASKGTILELGREAIEQLQRESAALEAELAALRKTNQTLSQDLAPISGCVFDNVQEPFLMLDD